MIRGVSFRLDGSLTSEVFTKLFDGINISDVVFENLLSQCETVLQKTPIKDIYTHNNIAELLADGVISAKLQGYRSTYRLIDCHTYEEFAKSDCEFLIAICDVIFVDIYAKNGAQRLFENATDAGLSLVSFITDENDSRTWLDVINN